MTRAPHVIRYRKSGSALRLLRAGRPWTSRPDASPVTDPTQNEEIMKKRFLLLAALAGVLSAGAPLVRSTAAQDAPKRVEVVSKKFAFEPGEITLKKGQPV